ncbi:MAG: exonuclease domain-containing protein [Chitinophagales bacterium]
MYSILDIETTGNHALRHHITEIAILNFDGEKITDRFTTFVRPDSSIPYFITELTGITNEMVEDAPSFAEVADAVDAFTSNRILIAHNAHFDYTFLKQAFQQAGKNFQRKTLCTLRLSRKIVPGLRSYALGNLCSALSLVQRPVHRAESDAVAALEVFQYLQRADNEGIIESFLNKRTSEFNFPPNLPKDAVMQLPEAPGVYYFLDEHGKILYVGKAKSLKQRVQSHFSGMSSTRSSTRLMNHIHRINYRLCGNELIAMLLESAEIKKHFPPFNAAQKITTGNYGLYCYEDGKGYHRFGIKKLKTLDRPVASFASLEGARSFVTDKVREFKLCPKLCGLQRNVEACYDHAAGSCDGACCGKVAVAEYNQRVDGALEAIQSDSKSYALIGAGRSADECTVIVMEDGKYLGFGFLDKERAPADFAAAKESIEHYKDNREVQTIIQTYLRKNTDYRIIAAQN